MTATRTSAFVAFATLLAALLAATCAEARVLVERDMFSSSPSNAAPYGEQGSRFPLGDGPYRSRADPLAGSSQVEDDEDLPLEELVDAQVYSESRDDDDAGDAEEAAVERSPRSSSAKASRDFDDGLAAEEQSRVVGKIERDAEQARAKLLPRFPSRWGPPPRTQTRDYVELPGGYGFGSSTLKGWIEKHAAEDSREGADRVAERVAGQTFAEGPADAFASAPAPADAFASAPAPSDAFASAPAPADAFASAEASAPASAPSPSFDAPSEGTPLNASAVRAGKTYAAGASRANASSPALAPTLRDIVRDHGLAAATMRGFGPDARCGAFGGVALVTVWGTVSSNVTDALVATFADASSEDASITEEEWSSTLRGVVRRAFRVAGVYRASFGGDSDDDRRACVANFFVNSKLAAERRSPGSKSRMAPAGLREFFLREVLPEDDARGDHDATTIALAVNCDASRRVELLRRVYDALTAKFRLTENDLHLSAETEQVEEDAAALLGLEPGRIAELRRAAAANPWVGDATDAVAVAEPACPELAEETKTTISGAKASTEETNAPETSADLRDTSSSLARVSSATTIGGGSNGASDVVAEDLASESRADAESVEEKTFRDDVRDGNDGGDDGTSDELDASNTDDVSDSVDSVADSVDRRDDDGIDSASQIRERFESRREERRMARRAARGEEAEDVPLEVLVDRPSRDAREAEEDEDEYGKR